MRASTHRKTTAICALALLSSLVACATPAPPPKPSPTATTAAPVFATDAEALAAATEAYAAYQSVADQIFAEGGNNPDRLRDVASTRLADPAMDDYLDVQNRGLYATGKNTFDNVKFQSRNEDAPGGRDVVIVYLCEDVSQSDVLDAAGESVVTNERPDRTALQVGFDWRDQNRDKLIVGSEGVWAGGDIC